jgi:glycosyltransferase involved in cell wall biosynthesis
MWNRKTVTVIFPTYREKASIFQSIQEFDSSGYVDEIIVVDNNAEEGTGEEVKRTRAKLIKEPRQGYGRAIKTGIENTKADLIIIAEPDGTFDGKDVVKLLAYSENVDTVFGSRTHLGLIDKNSEMTPLRIALDYIFGRIINILFMCSRLTDVGCTLRLTNRKGWDKIRKECKSDGLMFATEWELVAAKNKVKFIEIPIHFRERVGKSSVTDTFMKQAKWAILMFLYIWKVWIYCRMGKKLYS